MTKVPKNAGVIVGLLPSEEYTRLRPSTRDHHLTVAFIGGYDDPQITPEKLIRLWDSMIKLAPAPLQAQVTGETVFDNGGDEWAFVDLIDCPWLPDYRSIVTELLELHGLPLSRKHGLLPHITKRYSKTQGAIELVHNRNYPKFWFDKQVIWAGDERFEMELS
jgi:2'-5' RNA ligase